MCKAFVICNRICTHEVSLRKRSGEISQWAKRIVVQTLTVTEPRSSRSASIKFMVLGALNRGSAKCDKNPNTLALNGFQTIISELTLIPMGYSEN